MTGAFPTYSVGFVYVLSNKAMPGLVRVGMTSHLTEDRGLRSDCLFDRLPKANAALTRESAAWRP